VEHLDTVFSRGSVPATHMACYALPVVGALPDPFRDNITNDGF